MNPIATSSLGANIGIENLPDYSGMTAPVMGEVPQGTVPIHQSAWRTGGAGPINLAGQGIYMYGSEPFQPQPLPGWIAQRDAEAERRKQAQANEAIEAARRYQARINFQHAVSAGVPPQQAYALYGQEMAGMQPGRQQQFVEPEVREIPGLPGQTAVRTGRDRWQVVPKMPQDAGGEIAARPVVNEQGQVIGYNVPTSSGRSTTRMVRQDRDMSVTERVGIGNMLLESKNKELNDARGYRTKDPERYNKIVGDIKKIETWVATGQGDLAGIIGQEAAPAAAPAAPVVPRPVVPRPAVPTRKPAPPGKVWIKDKSANRVGLYPADKASGLPKDQFEILE